MFVLLAAATPDPQPLDLKPQNLHRPKLHKLPTALYTLPPETLNPKR